MLNTEVISPLIFFQWNSPSDIIASEEECWLGTWVNNVPNNGILEIFVKILDHIMVKLRAGKNIAKYGEENT